MAGDHVFLRSTRIGDLNLDGRVSIADFITLAAHFNQSGTAMWDEGDLNYDRSVTIADFIDLASNFNTSYSGESWGVSAGEELMLANFAAGVPEPGVAVGLSAVLVGMGRRKRR
jgi:hypothetical protein